MLFNQLKDSFYSNWLINILGVVFGLLGTLFIFWNEVRPFHFSDKTCKTKIKLRYFVGAKCSQYYCIARSFK